MKHVITRQHVLFLVIVAAVVGGCASSGAPSPPAAPPPTPPPENAPEAAVPEADRHNTLRWSTASEVENFGFDVYRGEGPDGPFVRLTEIPIEGAGTSDEQHRYTFVDETNDPRAVYYYYVESISTRGERERFTPVVKVKAKLNDD